MTEFRQVAAQGVAGAGLAEVLVALVVLSVAMLSMTTLLTRSIAMARNDLHARTLLRIQADAAELARLQPHMTAELHEALQNELQRRQTPGPATR